MRDILITLDNTESKVSFCPAENIVDKDTQINFIIGNSLHNAIDDPASLVIFRWNDMWKLLTNYEPLTYSAGTQNDTFGVFIYTPDHDVDLSNVDLTDIVKNYETTADENGEIIVRV